MERFKPLTREQYNTAVNSGFSHNDIITFEKKRKSDSIEGFKKQISDNEIVASKNKTSTMKDFTDAIPMIGQLLGNVAGGAATKTMGGSAIGGTGGRLMGEMQKARYEKAPAQAFIKDILRGSMPIVSQAIPEPQMTMQDYLNISRGNVQGAKEEGIGLVAGKALQKAAPIVGKVLNPVIQPIKNIAKTGRDYVFDKVATPITNAVKEKLKNNPEIMGKLMKLKDKSVEAIKKYGFDRVMKADDTLEQATTTYEKAFANKTKYPGNKINIANTLDKMEKASKSVASVQDHPINALIERLKILQRAPKGFYGKGAKSPSVKDMTRFLGGERDLSSIGKEVRINRDSYKSILSQLRTMQKRGDAYSLDVNDIIESLYDDAELSGLNGMKKAKLLYREAMEAGDVVKDVSKIDQLDANRVFADIIQVRDKPEFYKPILAKYEPYLGKAGAKKLVDEALAIRSGKNAKKAVATIGTILAGKAGMDFASRR